MIGYDFEVFKYNWLVVGIDPISRKKYVIWDDVDALEKLHEQYEQDIWIGFNSRHYDQYILKGILCGCNAYEINDYIINKKLPGWAFSTLLRKIFLINYDVAPLNYSLKQMEGFQGHNIHETSVDFNIDRPLTEEEKRLTEKYCTNDVEETLNVFAAKIDDFNSLMWLVKKFNFPLSYMSKTKAQICAEILECEKVDRDDEWDIYALDCIKLNKYEAVRQWFLDEKNHSYDKVLKILIAGVEHVFAWGGTHGAIQQFHYVCDDEWIMLHVDVESFYPREMIFHNLLTRNAKKPERFKMIFDQRMQLKHAGKKKEQAPYKVVINGGYGICKDPKSKAYDPRNANLICINGQLLLVDLIEKLEVVPSFRLVQSNTDGLIILIKRCDFDSVDDICYEWETRTNMKLGFDYIKEIWQKDVNNYVFVQYDGKIERKGAYVKELNPMDNDLPIINKALVDKFIKGVPVEKTINDCDDLVEFQKIVKLSSKYWRAWHNHSLMSEKCYRVFASKNPNDTIIGKTKSEKSTIEKFANTPQNCFIENGDIRNVKVPAYLDKQWYIDLARKRLQQYGVED